MADDEIVQKVKLEGAEEVQREFKKTGDAGEAAFKQMGKASEQTNFDRLSSQIGQLKQGINELANNTRQMVNFLGGASSASDKFSSAANNADQAVKKAAQGTAQLNTAIEKIPATTSTAESAIRRLVTTIGTLAGAYLIVQAGIERFKSGISSLNELGKDATAAGLSPDKFRELQFVLQGMGLSADEAKAKIKEFSDETEKSSDKTGRAAGAAQELVDKVRAQGQIFPETTDGIQAYREQIINMAQSMSRSGLDVDKLTLLMEKFRGKTDPKSLNEFTNELGKLISAAGGLNKTLSADTVSGGGMGKVIKIAPRATEEVQKLAKAWVEFQREMSAENFQKVEEALKGITDESKRTEVGTKILGEAMFKLFNNLGEQGNTVEELRQRYVDLGLTVDDTAVSIAQKLQMAMTEFNTAVSRGKEEFAQLFAPSITPIITQFTNLIRQNRGAIVEWVKSIADGAIKILTELFAVIREGDNAQIDNKWIFKVVEAFNQLGDTVKNVWKNIIIPAVDGIGSILEELAASVNKVLGLNLSKTDIGLVTILGALLGPINSLIIAFGAFFGQNEEGFEAMRAFFAKFGIDIDAVRAKLIEIKDDFVAAFSNETTVSRNPWVQQIVDFLKSTPALIIEVVAALALLRAAFTRLGTATAGKGASAEMGKLRGDALALGLIFADMTGILGTLEKAFHIVAITVGGLAAGMVGLAALLNLTLVPIFGSVAVAVGVLVAVLLVLLGNIETVEAALKFFGVDIRKTINQIDDLLSHSFDIRPFKAIGDAFEGFKKTITDLADAFSKGPLEFGKALLNLWTQFNKIMGDIAIAFAVMLAKLAGQFADWALRQLGINIDWAKVWEGLSIGFGIVLDAVKEKFQAVVDFFSRQINRLLTLIGKGPKEEAALQPDKKPQTFLEDLGETFTKLVVGFNKLIGDITIAFGKMLFTLGEMFVKWVAETLGGVDWSKVWEPFKAAFDIVIGAIKGAFDAVINFFAAQIRKLLDLIPGFGKKEEAAKPAAASPAAAPPPAKFLDADETEKAKQELRELEQFLDQINPKVNQLDDKLKNLSPPNPAVKGSLEAIEEQLDQIGDVPADGNQRISDLDDQLHQIEPKVETLKKQFASLNIPGVVSDAMSDIGTEASDSTAKVTTLGTSFTDAQTKALQFAAAGAKAAGDIETLFVNAAGTITRVIPEAVDASTGKIRESVGSIQNELTPLSTFLTEAAPKVAALQQDITTATDAARTSAASANTELTQLAGVVDKVSAGTDRASVAFKQLSSRVQIQVIANDVKQLNTNIEGSTQAVDRFGEKLGSIVIKAATSLRPSFSQLVIPFNEATMKAEGLEKVIERIGSGIKLAVPPGTFEKLFGPAREFEKNWANSEESVKRLLTEIGRMTGSLGESANVVKDINFDKLNESIRTSNVENGKLITDVTILDEKVKGTNSTFREVTDSLKTINVEAGKIVGPISEVDGKLKATKATASETAAAMRTITVEGGKIKVTTDEVDDSWEQVKSEVDAATEEVKEFQREVQRAKALGGLSDNKIKPDIVRGLTDKPEAASKKLDQIADKVKTTSQKATDETSKLIKAGFENIGTAITDAQGKVEKAFAAMKTATDGAKTNFDSLKEGVNAFKDAIVELSAKATESAEKFTQLAAATEPVKAAFVVEAVTTFNNALATLLPVMDQLIEKFKEVTQAGSLLGFEGIGNAITDTQAKIEAAFAAMKTAIESVNFDNIKESVAAFNVILGEASVKASEGAEKFTKLAAAAKPIAEALSAAAITTFNSALTTLVPVLDQTILKLQQMTQSARDVLTQFTNIGIIVVNTKAKFVPAFEAMKTAVDDIKINFDELKATVATFSAAIVDISAKLTELISRFTQLAGTAEPTKTAFDVAIVTAYVAALNALIPVVDQLIIKFQEMGQAAAAALSAAQAAAPTTPVVPGQESTPTGTPLPTQAPGVGGAPTTPGASGATAQLIAQAQAAVEQVRVLLQTATEQITTFIQTAIASIGTLFTGLGSQIATAVEIVNATVNQIREVFANAMNAVNEAVNSGISAIQTGLQNLAAAIQSGLSTEPLTAFASAMSQLASSVIANLDAMIQKFNEMAAAAQAAAAAAASASGGGGGGSSEEFAGGGFIRGKGGVDNNLIWASAGEFMVKARAVRKYGLGVLHAINDGRFKIPRFNLGGMIGGLGSSIAVGGPVLSTPTMSSNPSEFIDLGLPGGVTIPVTVTADVGRSIRNLAQRNRMNSIAKRQR